MPGRSTLKTWQIPFQNFVSGQAATLISNCIGRSVGNPSRFSIASNNVAIMQQEIAATTAGNYDLFARTGQSTADFTSSGNSLSPSVSVSTWQFFGPGMAGLVRSFYA
jgi:hypothetical protein